MNRVKWEHKNLTAYLNMSHIDVTRMSKLIFNQILDCINMGSSARIVEELAHLESFGKSDTKPEDPFRGEQIKGLWKKHIFDTSIKSISKNLLNHWKLNNSQSKKFIQMSLNVSKTYSKDGFLPGADRLSDTKNLANDLAVEFTNGLNERQLKNQYTGEWIVFAKHKNKNYYLTLANHDESNEAIIKKVQMCKTDFPFLF